MSIILRPTVMELRQPTKFIGKSGRAYGKVMNDRETGIPVLFLSKPPSFESCVYQLVKDDEDEQKCFFCGKELAPNKSTVDHFFAQCYGGPSIYKLKPVELSFESYDCIPDGQVLRQLIDNTVDITSVESVTNCHATCDSCNRMKSSVDAETFMLAMREIKNGKNSRVVRNNLFEAEKEEEKFFKEYHYVDEKIQTLISDIPCSIINDNWFHGPTDCQSKQTEIFFQKNGFFREIVLLDANLEVLANRTVVRLSKVYGIDTVNAIVIANVEVRPENF